MYSIVFTFCRVFQHNTRIHFSFPRIQHLGSQPASGALSRAVGLEGRRGGGAGSQWRAVTGLRLCVHAKSRTRAGAVPAWTDVLRFVCTRDRPCAARWAAGVYGRDL